MDWKAIYNAFYGRRSHRPFGETAGRGNQAGGCLLLKGGRAGWQECLRVSAFGSSELLQICNYCCLHWSARARFKCVKSARFIWLMVRRREFIRAVYGDQSKAVAAPSRTLDSVTYSEHNGERRPGLVVCRFQQSVHN